MLTREENETLCRVGPGTKMGRVMRRYWHPIAVSEQLPGPDSDPLRVTLLGERFVAFRDSSGRVGVLNELCMHRGASLALGRVEDNGVRCLYHGWKFGVDGTIQETPNHSDSRFRERLKAPCYPVREEGGIVWTYIGDKKKVPPFRRFSFMDADAANRTVIRVNVECNYLQLWEGGADSSHVGVLHSNVARPGWMDNDVRARRGRRQSGQSRGRGQCADPGDRGHRLRFPLRRRPSQPGARRRLCRQEYPGGPAHHALCAHHPGAELLLPCLRDAGYRRSHQHLYRHPRPLAREPGEDHFAARPRRSPLLGSQELSISREPGPTILVRTARR